MGTDGKKETSRDAYSNFVEQNFNTTVERASDVQKSRYLTEWYIREIHNQTRSIISDDDIEAGIVDGANDLGVDFVHRDDGQVYVFQTKYAGKRKPIDVSHIQTFQGVLCRMRDYKSWKPNAALRELLADIDWENDTFHLRFISLAKLEGQSQIQANQSLLLPDDVAGLKDRVAIEYLGEGELSDEYRNALAQSSGIPNQLVLYSSGTRNNRRPIMEVHSGEHRSFVLTVGATQWVEIFNRVRDALFTLNIRNFIGNTRTNKEIRETAAERGELFFLFNNGVSCLAKRATLIEDGSALQTEGLQVINGAQTVKALVKAKSEGFKKEPLVLVRVTEVTQGYGAGNKAFSSDITKYNNSQNVIKVSDFRSNDPIQNDLRNKFEYHRAGRRVQYIPKRTDKNASRNTFPIKLEDYAKVCYSFLFDPIKFAGSTSFLFDDSDQGGYTKVFGNGVRVWDVMPDEEFRLRSAVWWMSEEFNRALKLFKSGELSQEERGALERKWFLLFAAKLVLQRWYGEESYKDTIRPHYRGDWEMDKGSVGQWYRELFEISKESLVYVYSAAREDETFVHRNWTRSPKTLDALRNYILRSPIRNLPNL